MTKIDLLKILSELQLAYPNVLTEEKLDYYVVKLYPLGLDPVLLQAAISSLTYKCKFMPVFAEILEEYKFIKEAMSGKQSLLPDEAWAMVQKAIRSYGYDRGLEHIEDETARRVAINLGWRELCYGDIDMEDTRRAHYIKMYTGAINQTKQRQQLQFLAKSIPQLNTKIKAIE